MSQLTKAQLIDQLAALRIHCDRIETENASLKAAVKTTPSHRPAYQRAPDAALEERHTNYVRALIAAREEAARTGRTVRVF